MNALLNNEVKQNVNVARNLCQILLKFVSHACEHEISLSEIYLAQFPAVSKANNIFEHTRGRSNMSAVFQ